MGVKEIRASHILVGSKEQAQEIWQKCKAGADFAYMAEKYSKCLLEKKEEILDSLAEDKWFQNLKMQHSNYRLAKYQT